MKKILSMLILISFSQTALAEDTQCPTPNSETISNEIEISAVYPNPNSGENEWVELSNLGEDDIDLSLYTLEDATAKPWALSGTLEETIKIEGFPFQLNNSDETVTLKTADGLSVDVFSYASSNKGEILSTETEAITETSDSRESTEISVELSEELSQSTPLQWPIFSEALPNPEGSDSTDEWIELYNPYGENLSLDGLYLDDSEGGSSPYALTGTLAAESYLLLYVSETKITLNNDTDHIRLLGVNDEILWDIVYTDSTEGNSYAIFSGFYDWTEEPSPGTENTWAGESEEEDDDDAESNYENGDLSDQVAVTEVFPNPEGPDAEEEWIEITNNGIETVNLGNWTLDDGEGGSEPFTFPDNTIIAPGETLILYRTKTGIALNNSNETVQLSDYTGETMSEIYYETSEEDQSYSEIQIEEVESTQASASGLGNQVFSTWQWVTPSPGALNPIWKQIKGEVLDWDGALLTLFDGVSTWTFKVAESKNLDPLLYETGNQVLVQASSSNGLFEIMHSELLSSKPMKESSSTPWSFIGTAVLVLSYLGYEWFKRNRKPEAIHA